MMAIFFSALFLLSSVKTSKSEGLTIFDNFDYGSPGFGAEGDMDDYAVLAADRKMDLPTSFTICSSVHMNIMTGPFVFYQLYQDDGKPWLPIWLENWSPGIQAIDNIFFPVMP